MQQKPAPTEAATGLDRDTIAAVATPPGRGGIGVIRISGPRAAAISYSICGVTVPRRRATLATFRDAAGEPIDRGLVLRFEAPHSFTGEDVVELHGHGGPVVMDLLLAAALAQGARLARPGEFTERSFHNNKIDLAQAEAVADLIASASNAAARSAFQSLSGRFSALIDGLSQEIIDLRVFVEGAIDFPEEEIDFIQEGHVAERLERLIGRVGDLLETAGQGAILNEGITLVLAGRPNVGKSSLLNRLLGFERAIVTNVPGTTRDVLAERMNLDGIPVRIVDTAGLRDSDDAIEQEGVRRARLQILDADRVLLIRDDTAPDDSVQLIQEQALPTERLTVVVNKIDLTGTRPGVRAAGGVEEFAVSALTGSGIAPLIAHIKAAVGYRDTEGVFSARRRHVDAITRCQMSLRHGAQALLDSGAGELLADDLRVAHTCLGEIVGEVSSDALLGEIFARFCIGK